MGKIVTSIANIFLLIFAASCEKAIEISCDAEPELNSSKGWIPLTVGVKKEASIGVGAVSKEIIGIIQPGAEDNQSDSLIRVIDYWNSPFDCLTCVRGQSDYFVSEDGLRVYSGSGTSLSLSYDFSLEVGDLSGEHLQVTFKSDREIKFGRRTSASTISHFVKGLGAVQTSFINWESTEIDGLNYRSACHVRSP